MDIQAIDAQASVLMKRGIRLMSDAQPGAVAEALDCFDQALALRSGLPFAEVPLLRYGLAACWLNRGDALMRLGDAARPAAIGAYDEGIALLRDLPMAEDPRFPRRLAMAHQNRGLLLQAGGPDPGSLRAAIAAFTDAIGILNHDAAARISDRTYLLAAAWMNLAKARVAVATAESEASARDAALRAISLVTGLEENDADLSEVGLKARHAFCQTVAGRLSLPQVSNETMPDDVHAATDAVDDGLRLVRHWEHLGITRFRAIAYDLFRFGARVYARYQPQFLDEFIRDNTDAARSSSDYVESAAMRSAVEEARRLVGR